MGPWEKKNSAVAWPVRRQEMLHCLLKTLSGTLRERRRDGSETRFEVIFSLRQTEGKGSCSELKMELMN